MPKQKKVYITGAGVVSPIGSSVEEFMSGIENSVKGIGTIKNFDTQHFPVSVAAEAKRNGEVIRTQDHEDRKQIFIEDAVNQIFIKKNKLNEFKPEERSLCMGSGIDYFDIHNYTNTEKYKTKDWKKFSLPSYKAAFDLVEKYDIQGGCNINVAACVASTHALGLAFRLLKTGKRKIVLGGGYDSMLTPLHYMGFHKLGALSDYSGNPSDACRPFDLHRRGLVLGEGGVAYSIETEDTAGKNEILAQICGYASTMDSYMVTDPLPDGKMLAKAAQEAISEAGISPQDIDCVHLHGTGTPKNAISEAAAMKEIFGEKAIEIPVFSLKGQIGHLIGACGAMEILGVIYSFERQQVPITVNFETPDPQAPLRVITGKHLSHKIDYILKLNSAFGGQNTALVLKRT